MKLVPGAAVGNELEDERDGGEGELLDVKRSAFIVAKAAPNTP